MSMQGLWSYQRTSYIRRGIIMYYERIYGFDNLHKAFKLARRGKRWKPATARFEVNLLENVPRSDGDATESKDSDISIEKRY